jgi:hypothetical protein
MKPAKKDIVCIASILPHLVQESLKYLKNRFGDLEFDLYETQIRKSGHFTDTPIEISIFNNEYTLGKSGKKQGNFMNDKGQYLINVVACQNDGMKNVVVLTANFVFNIRN